MSGRGDIYERLDDAEYRGRLAGVKRKIESGQKLETLELMLWMEEHRQRLELYNPTLGNGMYVHRKSGKGYAALDLTLREGDLEPMVTYAPLKWDMTPEDMRFSRPLREWCEKVDGEPRYARARKKLILET